MIEVKNLTKRYGQNLALDRVSFKIEEGSWGPTALASPPR